MEIRGGVQYVIINARGGCSPKISLADGCEYSYEVDYTNERNTLCLFLLFVTGGVFWGRLIIGKVFLATG